MSASFDALRATRALARLKGRELERKAQVSEVSQGGPATMMVGRALDQEKADRYFRLGALAPVSCPFDLSAFEAAANDEIDKCAYQLAAHGVGATLIDVGDVGHNGSVRLAVPGIIRFFDAARKAG
ncbi:hypothetical protein ACFYM2_03515 [Streptomyces sp. NPDC006711]|uniref:hypothetical protein n=1 Tax=Streptomyces sp. NPDC006711 TaxID=3364762 RepID=UPI00367B703B